MSMHGGFMGRMQDKKDESYKLSQINKKVIKMFIAYIKPYSGLLILAISAICFVAAANVVGPYLSKLAIDTYILPKNIDGLNWVLLAYFVVYGMFWAASYWSSFLSLKLGQHVVADIRKDLFGHVTSLSLDFFSEQKTGEVMARITNDVNALAEFIASGVVNLASDLLTLIGIITAMFILNVKLAAIVYITIPIIVFGTSLIGRHMRKAYSSVRQKAANLNAGVEENISGIKVVQSMSQESDNIIGFDKLNKENYKANIKAVLISAIFFPFMSISGALGNTLVILAGGIMVIKGEASIGVVMAFLAYVNRFFLPLRELSQIYNVYQGAAASAERIHEYFEIEPAIASPENPVKLNTPVKGKIEFCDVTFHYEPDRPIIENMNIVIPAGQATAIVGPTGSGKTTMIKLIARLYDVSKGVVRIDDIDIKSIALDDLRNAIMVVPQEVFLFSGTIKENISYGKPEASDSEVIEAAQKVSADRFIAELPAAFDTQVGEGGMLLSGGQRQLIALARAVLADRPVLILDEATSSVDAASEMLIQQALDYLLADRTSIIIAHRFTTLKRADKFIVLNKGKIIGYDTHEALLDSCELYNQLYKKQWLNK